MEETVARPATCATRSTQLVANTTHTHTCSLGDHRGPHFCPKCKAMWVPERNYNRNHPHQ